MSYKLELPGWGKDVAQSVRLQGRDSSRPSASSARQTGQGPVLPSAYSEGASTTADESAPVLLREGIVRLFFRFEVGIDFGLVGVIVSKCGMHLRQRHVPIIGG